MTPNLEQIRYFTNSIDPDLRLTGVYTVCRISSSADISNGRLKFRTRMYQELPRYLEQIRYYTNSIAPD